MGARDDVHAKGWDPTKDGAQKFPTEDPTKDGALVPRTLGAASWATSGWHFVRCAMENARATRQSTGFLYEYCSTCAKVHIPPPQLREFGCSLPPCVSLHSKKAQSVSKPAMPAKRPISKPHAHPAGVFCRRRSAAGRPLPSILCKGFCGMDDHLDDGRWDDTATAISDRALGIIDGLVFPLVLGGEPR